MSTGNVTTNLSLPDSVRVELLAERKKQWDALLVQKSVAMFEVSSEAEIRGARGFMNPGKYRRGIYLSDGEGTK